MTDPLSISASIVALLQLSATLLSFTYKFLEAGKEIQTAVTNLHSQLRDLEALLLSFQALLNDYASTSSASTRLAEWNTWLQECHSLLESFVAQLNPPASQWKRFRDKMRWPLKEKDMTRLVDLIGQRKSSIALGIALDQTNVVLKVKEDTSCLRTREEEKLRVEIIRWLAPVEVESNYDATRRRCHTGTGRWFLEGRDFVEWKTKDGASLWLHGIPGSGKTVLSGTIIDAVQTTFESDHSVGLAFFFFTFSEPEKQTVSSMLTALVSQLFLRLAHTPEELKTLYTRTPGTPPLATLLKLFNTLLKEFSRTFIVLDALDEVAVRERDTLLRVLHQMHDPSFVNMNTLLTSRREHYVLEGLSSLSIPEVTMNTQVVDLDICSFVSEILMVDPKFKKWDSSVKADIETALVNGANGMFRWVECQLESIRTCRNANAVRRALSSLPKTLDETYNRVVFAIPENDAEFARQALMWLAFSERLLTVNELAEAIIIKPGTPTVDLDDRFPEPEEILAICGSLVTTVAGRYKGDPERVVLAHYSVKEYLTSERLWKEMQSTFFLTARTARPLIAEVCLTYLSFDDFSGALPQDNGRILPQKYPLLDYAAHCWGPHINSIADMEERKRLEVIATDLFLDEGNKFLHWVLVCGKRGWSGGRRDPVFGQAEWTGSALYHFSLLGLYNAVELGINRGADVNIQGGEYVTALGAAAHGGFEDIVRLLLANDADVNVQGWYGHQYTSHSGSCCTVLQEAIKEGHDNIALLLMENGANVNARGSTKHGTALSIAAGQDNEHMVLLLVQKGANVNMFTPRGSVLAAAAATGNAELVRFLLGHGAKVNIRAQDRFQRSAIAAAALSGNEEVVALLVAAGCDVNAKYDVGGGKNREYYQTALEEVSIRESGMNDDVNERAIQLLLKYGAQDGQSSRLSRK